jgi:hypothetical protein
MRHFLNGIEVSPRNRDEIGVVCDFTGNPDVLSLNTDTLVLPREANQMVKQHIQTSGLFIGIPYQVQMDGGITLDYYIDLCDPGSKPVLRQHDIEVKIKRSKGYDDFRSKADGTSFELIVKDKGINFFSYKRIPFFIIKDNVNEQMLTLSLSLFIMTKEIIAAAKDLAKSFTAFLNASPGGIAEALANLIIDTIYFAALVIAAIQYIAELIKLIFPRKRYLNGCYYKELMFKACQYLGYNFSSELFDNDPGWFLLPVPINRNNNESIFQKGLDDLGNNFNLGYPTASDSVGLVGQFFDACETQFNGRTFVIGNTIHFERRDWLQNNSTLLMAPALNIQADRDESFTYNTEDAWKRYYIHYASDFTDVNTVEGVNFGLSDAEYSCENSVPGANNNLITIKGLNDVSIPFAMGFNKDKLTFVEVFGRILATGWDGLTNALTFGNGSNFAAQISSRVDALKISQQYFSTTKSLYVYNRPNNTVLINQDFNTNNSARALWNKYHYINQIQLNQFEVHENARTRIRQNDFVNLLSNNYVFIDNQICEVLKMTWIDEKSYCEITYRKPSTWATGKVITQTIND